MVTSQWNRSAILLCVSEEGKGSRSGAEYSINHLNFNYLPSHKPMHKQLYGPQSDTFWHGESAKAMGLMSPLFAAQCEIAKGIELLSHPRLRLYV